MKKILLLCVILSLVLAGCSSNKDLEDKISELENHLSELEEKYKAKSSEKTDVTSKPIENQSSVDDIVVTNEPDITPVAIENKHYSFDLDNCSADEIASEIKRNLYNIPQEGISLDDLYKLYDFSNGEIKDLVTLDTHNNANSITIKYKPVSDVQSYIKEVLYYRIFDVQGDMKGSGTVKYHYDNSYQGQGVVLSLIIKSYDLAASVFDELVKIEEEYRGNVAEPFSKSGDNWEAVVNYADSSWKNNYSQSRISMSYNSESSSYTLSVNRSYMIK